MSYTSYNLETHFLGDPQKNVRMSNFRINCPNKKSSRFLTFKNIFLIHFIKNKIIYKNLRLKIWPFLLVLSMYTYLTKYSLFIIIFSVEEVDKHGDPLCCFATLKLALTFCSSRRCNISDILFSIYRIFFDILI